MCDGEGRGGVGVASGVMVCCARQQDDDEESGGLEIDEDEEEDDGKCEAVHVRAVFVR